MHKLENYITGKWIQGEGAGQVLRNAVTGEPLCLATTAGIDFKAILEYGRTVGNPQVRKLSFQERGKMLKALALYLRNHLETFYSLSYQTGATRADSWTDIEGGIGNLFSYASLRRKFPDDFFYVEGEAVSLSKSGNFIGQHLLVPKEGVAIHINAYNFPVWGMLEKFAVNFLAGVPAIIKPATLTSFLTKAVVEKIQESGILPPGSLQLICGSAGDLLDHVCSQDIVTFTGSAATGLLLKSNPAILRENVPFTMEADSLNCIVLGEDITPSMPEWEIFIREIRKEMTSKAGQKCTAIRRIFVPEHLLEAVAAALSDALSRTIIGNPRNETVRMGSLAGLAQREEVRGRVQQLLASSRMIYGSLDSVELCDADATNGAFLGPVLLLNESPFRSTAVHEIEDFGCVADRGHIPQIAHGEPDDPRAANQIFVPVVRPDAIDDEWCAVAIRNAAQHSSQHGIEFAMMDRGERRIIHARHHQAPRHAVTFADIEKLLLHRLVRQAIGGLQKQVADRRRGCAQSRGAAMTVGRAEIRARTPRHQKAFEQTVLDQRDLLPANALGIHLIVANERMARE